MEDESNNSEMETALSNDDLLNKLSAQFDDMPEASDNSEQADEHVEENASEETDVETPDEAEQFFELNGEQVALSELRSGYLRQADYTRKTQEIAEQRKAYQLQQGDINQARHDALLGIEMMKKEIFLAFGDELQNEIDWQELSREDPHTYIQLKEQWEARNAKVQSLYQAEVQLRQQLAESERQQHEYALRESQTQFLTKYPEMRDANTSSEALVEITQILIDNGFSKEEIQGVSDYRIVGVLYELSKLMKAQKAIAPVVQKMEQKPVISQKQNSSKTSDAYDRDFNKFNKSRNEKDGIALISRLL